MELAILGDTTAFMERGEDGSFLEDRGSREVWSRVYRYALDTFGDSVNQKAMGHNAGFQAAAFDYYVANRMFLYNRIFSGEATEEERELELSVLNVTEPNTPVFGCWYLQADEGSLVPLLTENYKYVAVSYESFNVSWTSGLPREELVVEEEKLTLDPSRKYVAFTFSEGDNNSYLQYRMPAMFQSPARGEYPIGWTIAPACWDMNPNIIRYYRQNWCSDDGLASPEAGIVYVYHTPPEGSQDAFFALSDACFARMGDVGMRVLNPDVVDPLPYVEKMEHLNALFCGYLETGNDHYSNDLSHFLFRDTPVFLNYNGREAAGMIQADGGAPGFYSISLYGWSQDPSSVSSIMEALREEYVAVTPNQLADLYRQYYGGEFTDVTWAAFRSGMSRSEMGFLYRATDYSDYDGMAKSRFAAGEDSFIYRFDLADAVREAVFYVNVTGDYQIEASADDLHWTVLEKGNVQEKTTPEGVGELSFSPVSNPDTKRYLLSLTGDKVTERGYGASREVDGSDAMVYRFVTDPGVTEARLRLNTSGPFRISVSNDGAQYQTLYEAKSGEIPQSPNLIDITAFGAGGRPVYVKFEKSVPEANKPARLYKLRLLTNRTSQALLDRLDKEREADALVKAGSEGELALLDDSRSANHFLYEESARCLTPSADAAFVYRFDTRSEDSFESLGIEPVEVEKLRISLRIANAYKVSVSGDGINWTELADSNDAGVQLASNQKDLPAALTEYMQDGVAYVKVSRSDAYVEGQTHDGLVWNLQFYLN